MASSAAFAHQYALTDKPLTPQELEDAEALVQRLRGEILTSFDKLSVSSRSSLELARELGLNRNICQRVASGMDKQLVPLDALLKLPGPDGLLLLAKAMASRGGRSAKQAPLIAAVKVYEQFIRSVGGSQAGLRRRIQATARPAPTSLPGEETIATRRRLFEAAAEWMGHTVDVYSSISVMGPSASSPDHVDCAYVQGLIGLRSLSKPVTLISHFGVTSDPEPDIDKPRTVKPLAGVHPSGLYLIDEFCSDPLPSGVVDAGTERSRVIIEPPAIQAAGRLHMRAPAVDIVTGSRIGPDVSPIHHTNPEYQFYAIIRRPTLRMISDVYLHRSLAASCLPTMAAFHAHPNLSLIDPLTNWDDRISGKFPIELLGAGIENAESSSYSRQQALTSRVFQLADWNVDEFVGYRCDVVYPAWNTVYFMMFDLRGAQK